jgi:GTPase SAR1 family protein
MHTCIKNKTKNFLQKNNISIQKQRQTAHDSSTSTPSALVLQNINSHSFEKTMNVPSLRSKPWWTLDELSLSIPPDALDAMQNEFHAWRKDSVQFQKVVEPIESKIVGKWEVIYLMKEGNWIEDAVARCPKTCEFLSNNWPIMQNELGHVYFSLVSLGTEILTHHGPTNARLRVQIPIDIPQIAEVVSSITVNGVTKEYEKNCVLVFDDSFIHNVVVKPESWATKIQATETEIKRVVLLCDIWHPDMTPELKEKFQDSFLLEQPVLKDSSEVPAPISDQNESNPNVELILGPVQLPPNARGLMKFPIVGDYFVGKTAFIHRFCKRSFGERQFLGIDFMCLFVKIAGELNRISLWDMASPERYIAFTSSRIRGADGIILCYDITSRRSFDRLANEFLSKTQSPIYNQSRDIIIPPFIIVGMKSDLVADSNHDNNNQQTNNSNNNSNQLKGRTREVSYEEGENLAKQHSSQYFECSALTGEGCDELMKYLIWISYHHTVYQTKRKNAENPSETPKKKEGKCIVS